MKHLRYLLMLALVAVPLVGCDEDDDDDGGIIEPVVIHGTVSGTVSVEGTGVAGVSVSLVGANSQQATTGSGGGFSFANVEGGSYAVAISGTPSDATFANTSATTSITTDGQTVTVDFSGSWIRTSQIAGQVTVDGMGLAGVSVTASGPEGDASDVTDNGGNYSFTGLRAGEYTVSLSNIPAAYSFTTATQNITVGTGEAQIVGFQGTELVTVDPVTASVVIKSVTTGATNVPVNPAAVAGQIDVTLQIDPGENDLNKIALLLNGTEVASQTLSNTVAARPVMEQSIFEVVFSINTAAIAAMAPVYPNGAYQLAAELGLDNALETSVLTSIDLTFANLDTFIAEAVPSASMIGGATASNPGALYYDAPIAINITPIVYSGRTIASVTTVFTDTGAGGTTALTDAAAPFANTYTLAGYASAAIAGTGNEAFTVTAANYTDGTAFGPANGGATLPLAVTSGSNFFVDNAVPATAALALTQQVTSDAVCCSNNWVNSAYAPAAGYTLAGDNAAGVFIGGVTGQIFAGAATATNATIAGGTAITTIADAGLDNTALVNTTYSMVHVETDAFGNANTPTRMVASAPDNTATTFGIDDVVPATQTVTGQAHRAINPAAGGSWVFATSDDRAGFSGTPVRAYESLFNTAGTSYPNYGINNPALSTFGDPLNYGLTLAATDNTMTAGYYYMEGYVLDQGGNAFGTPVVRETLIDMVAPVAQNVQIPGSLVGGALTTFTAPVTDNLDLVSADFDFQFGAATDPWWPFGDPDGTDRILGTAWDATLTTSATATATVNFVESIEDNAMTPTIIAANWVRVGAMDAAGNQSALQFNNFAAGTVTPTTTSYSATGMANFAIATVVGDGTTPNTNLCNGQGATACAANDGENLTVTITTQGPAGTYAPPFAGGYIYLYIQTAGVDGVFGGLNGADDGIFLADRISGASGSVTDAGAGVTGRTYTYTMTINKADAAGIAAATPIQIVAIGVNGSGAGIFSTVNAAFTVVNGS